jgi:hypothetical protein
LKKTPFEFVPQPKELANAKYGNEFLQPALVDFCCYGSCNCGMFRLAVVVESSSTAHTLTVFACSIWVL